MSFLCVPSEAVAGGTESNPLGSLDLVDATFAFGKHDAFFPAIAHSVQVGYNINTDQRNESGLYKIFSMIYIYVLLGTHFSPHTRT